MIRQVWIIGEYSRIISNCVEFLETFMEGFTEEPLVVQMQLLSAAVKAFLVRGEEARPLAQKAIKLCTTECYSIDLRDRAQTYSRLLTVELESARKTVLTEKPTVIDSRRDVDPKLLDDLLTNVGNLNSILFRPSWEIRASTKTTAQRASKSGPAALVNEDLLIMEDESPSVVEEKDAQLQIQNGSNDPLGMGSLMDSLPPQPQTQPKSSGSSSLLDDLFGPSPGVQNEFKHS